MLLLGVAGACGVVFAVYVLYSACSAVWRKFAQGRRERREKNAEWDNMLADLDAKDATQKDHGGKKKGTGNKKSSSQKARHRNPHREAVEEVEDQPLHSAPKPQPLKPKKAEAPAPAWMLEEDHQLGEVQLKGSKHPILSVSCAIDGSFVASCSRERCIFLHPQAGLENKPGASRINLNQDYATSVAATGNAVAALMSDTGNVCVYSPDGSTLCEFEPGHSYMQPMVGMVFADTALAYDAAAHAMVQQDRTYTLLTFDKETLFRVHALSGNKTLSHTKAASIDTKKVVNHDCSMNQHARYVAVANFQDCKLWDLGRKAAGPGCDVKPLTTISHKSRAVGMDAEGNHVAIVCTDGTIRMFSMNVELSRGAKPKELWQSEPLVEGRFLNRLLFSPDGLTIAAVDSNTIVFVCSASGRILGRVLGAHSPLVHVGEASMTGVSWLADSRRVVSGGLDRLLKVWRNPNH
eukprot:TRINITY_DN1345_c0_g1_i3.p1 TRINITY_DN1345_c0_g1~~TRINITY_DN1345_c0_g1_i3.p1  ORF type:complete len:464 (-),score=126.27 TRINITY_DN1345_c0_g1_i3:98-1489(-)